MAQHFLLSAAARTLSLSAVARMSDEEAREAFKRIRWADNGGEPYCPRCGCVDVYAQKTRPTWMCKGCAHQFSVTSGTIFSNRKLPVRDYLLAIAIFVNGAKGHSALQLSRDLDCQYRTAFVMAHKIREAIGAEMNNGKVSGEVEIDGAYFGGYVKPANYKEHRRDRRKVANQTGKRRVVVVVRERNGRSITSVFKGEDDSVPMVRDRVEPGSMIYADEASHWDQLHAKFSTKRINHSFAYSHAGASTNMAESFFSRLRRAEIGIHHHISGAYLEAYSDEMAWREDNRRRSNGELYLMATKAVLAHPISKRWAGYWNRNAA